MSHKMTRSFINNVEPSGKDSFYWDSELKGFGIRVSASGKKSYLIRYRIGGRGGIDRRTKIGAVEVISLENARKSAKEILGIAASGKDPRAEKDSLKKTISLNAAVERFMDEHVLVRLKPKTYAEYKRSYEKNIKSNIGNLKVTKIDRNDVSKLHHELRETPYLANRVLSFLSKLFNWCEKMSLRDDNTNPCKHVTKYKEKSRERFLTQDEIASLNEVLNNAEKNKTETIWHISLYRLLLLTGARLSEVQQLKWAQVHIEENIIELLNTKTGKRNLHITEQVRMVLKNIPKLHGNPYLICGLVDGKFAVSVQKPWQRLRRLADLEDVRLHDLRHTYASIMASSGVSLPIIGAILGHSQPQTTAKYTHFYDEPIKAAAKAANQFIADSKKNT